MSEPLGSDQNQSFSTLTPQLQLAWDSTSMGLLKECPRKYYYSIIKGYQPRHLSVHLTFGLHFHAALERYDHARSAGKSHNEAQLVATRYALEITWNRDLGRPWTSGDPNKNRLTLVRSIVWYLEQFSSDPLQTVQLASGKPAVELSFRLELDYSTTRGEKFMLCGHLDRVATLNGQTYIVDRKTSKHTLTPEFFDKFSPDNQFSTYVFGGSVVYALPISGLIVDAAQVAVTFSRFQRGFITRTPEQIEEWHQDLGIWLRHAETYALASHWPQNDKSCSNYGGCPFRSVCSKSPNVREMWLEADFTRRQWDPLSVRGDI